MNNEFQGRHVVVTGATGELGSAVVDRLVSGGALVYAPCRDSVKARRLAERHGASVCVTSGVDLADVGAVAEFYASIPALWASIHVAGGFAASRIASSSLDELRHMMAINAETAFVCCREAVTAFRRNGGATAEGLGRIVNVVAAVALEPRRGAGKVAYTASKAALAAFTVALAEEVAGEGIWVNAVAPSILDTPANRAASPDADPSPWAKVEDVAATIAHLASPLNGAARGAVVPVYGRS